jgi:poly-gamma-glutamate capsule biosynthesis protein CapA/YwtB (metallophosphatase superfamily)
VPSDDQRRSIPLFLCGDVMTGRGIDQALPHPGAPQLFERCVRDARDYVALAERANGPIPRPLGFRDVWGDALEELARRGPVARIVNLETAVTTSDDAWTGKGIHYRMHPANVGCLTAASLDCCVLANNHVLDWGYDGLAQTLATLHAAGIRTAGAGADEDEAGAPAVLPLPAGGRVLVFALGHTSAGVPPDWAARAARPGVCLVRDLTPRSVGEIAARVRAVRTEGDVVVASVHWGANWGHRVSRAERAFAHMLVDEAGVDVVHGHSSHHPKAIEIHRGRLVLYGCGDLLNDYEGIGGYEAFRGDVAMMVFATLRGTGELDDLTLVPTRIRRFRIGRASRDDAAWLAGTLARESRTLGTVVNLQADSTIVATSAEPAGTPVAGG